MKYKDITGNKYGRLTVISRLEAVPGIKTKWRCVCDCGNYINASITDLQRGRTGSCGCLRRETMSERGKKRATHGGGHTRIYSVWCNMKRRLYNKDTKEYANYGGRGITMCDEWLNNFATFRTWAMRNGFADNLTLDRIDNDGNYEPNNCRWVTRATQNNNKRNNRRIVIDGVERNSSEWANMYGIDPSTFHKRHKTGWTGKDLLRPSGSYRHSNHKEAS